MKSMRVLYHDNCFDGVSSAAVFSRFYRGHVDANADIEYEGLTHKAGQLISPESFSGGENAIVDFKYCATDKLTWWFDHHESAFLSQEDEAHFRRDTGGRKFHDPAYRSCTKFIAHIAKSVFGMEFPDLEELIHWADIIDGAQFESVQAAVELKEPALRLMLVIEASKNSSLMHRIIRNLQSRTMAQVLDDPDVREKFESLYKHHVESIDIMRRAAHFKDGVIQFDVSDHDLDGYNKFIPYYLFPQGVYCVGVSKSPLRSKVSVGTNPWTPRERQHNLAKLCEHYGGGGHAVVAAISFKPEELDTARAAAREIAEKLQHDLRQ